MTNFFSLIPDNPTLMQLFESHLQTHEKNGKSISILTQDIKSAIEWSFYPDEPEDMRQIREQDMVHKLIVKLVEIELRYPGKVLHTAIIRNTRWQEFGLEKPNLLVRYELWLYNDFRFNDGVL